MRIAEYNILRYFLMAALPTSSSHHWAVAPKAQRSNRWKLDTSCARGKASSFRRRWSATGMWLYKSLVVPSPPAPFVLAHGTLGKEGLSQSSCHRPTQPHGCGSSTRQTPDLSHVRVTGLVGDVACGPGMALPKQARSSNPNPNPNPIPPYPPNPHLPPYRPSASVGGRLRATYARRRAPPHQWGTKGGMGARERRKKRSERRTRRPTTVRHMSHRGTVM